jgi:hypothetical protein
LISQEADGLVEHEVTVGWDGAKFTIESWVPASEGE